MEIFVVILKMLLVISLAWAGFCIFVLIRITYFSERITPENQLRIVNEERKKLKINNSIIINVTLGECYMSYTVWSKRDKSTFNITLDPNGRTRFIIKHELFHVYVALHDYKLNETAEEFLAFIYEVTNLNLLSLALFKKLVVA